MYPYLKQGSNLNMVIDNKSYVINNEHLNYKEIIEAIKNDDSERVKSLVDVKESLNVFSEGNVTIEDETILWKGVPLQNFLCDKMLDMFREGFSVTPLVLFLENLMQNPSNRSVTELYRFLERSNMPITPDGHFLAFKKVRDDYKDVHSGTFDNSVGQVVSMERNQVDDDKDRTCSNGLHFCSEDYLANFSGERIMILKINPRDVVSIPSDYGDTKGRCCLYEVIGELENTEKQTISTTFIKPVQENGYNIFGVVEEEEEDDYDRYEKEMEESEDSYCDCEACRPGLSYNY